MRFPEPGTVVTVTPGGTRTRTYWSLRTAPHTDDQRSTIARVCELLDDTVSRQLISDVPKCVLLSGGPESSAMRDHRPGHAERARRIG